MASGDLRATTQAIVSAAVAHAKVGASTVRAAALDPPAQRSALQSFAYGLALPFAVLRATLADKEARKKLLRVSAGQLVAVVVVAALVTTFSDDADAVVDKMSVHISISSVHAFWSLVIGAFVAAESVVVALSRDYNKDTQREVARASGVPPEDEPLVPRVRLNMKWLWQQAKRKLRGWLVFAVILPLASVVGWIPTVGQGLAWVVLAAWGLYWTGVFTCSKTARAWDEEAPAEPVFLRGYERVAARAKPVRWLTGWYARIVRRFTRGLLSPAARFEKSPVEMSGLAVARVLRVVPGVSIVFRPIFPIAAAHIVLRRERELEAERLRAATAGPYRAHAAAQADAEELRDDRAARAVEPDVASMDAGAPPGEAIARASNAEGDALREADVHAEEREAEAIAEAEAIEAEAIAAQRR